MKKRQRRLGGVDSMVISLTAKGLTTGEVEAHLMELYSTEISRETISKITDWVIDEMADWQNRPLDRVYPVIFIDALVVKIRDGQVANRPVYAAIGFAIDGKRDILVGRPLLSAIALEPQSLEGQKRSWSIKMLFLLTRR